VNLAGAAQRCGRWQRRAQVNRVGAAGRVGRKQKNKINYLIDLIEFSKTHMFIKRLKKHRNLLI